MILLQIPGDDEKCCNPPSRHVQQVIDKKANGYASQYMSNITKTNFEEGDGDEEKHLGLVSADALEISRKTQKKYVREAVNSIVTSLCKKLGVQK